MACARSVCGFRFAPASSPNVSTAPPVTRRSSTESRSSDDVCPWSLSEVSPPSKDYQTTLSDPRSRTFLVLCWSVSQVRFGCPSNKACLDSASRQEASRRKKKTEDLLSSWFWTFVLKCLHWPVDGCTDAAMVTTKACIRMLDLHSAFILVALRHSGSLASAAGTARACGRGRSGLMQFRVHPRTCPA